MERECNVLMPHNIYFTWAHLPKSSRAIGGKFWHFWNWWPAFFCRWLSLESRSQEVMGAYSFAEPDQMMVVSRFYWFLTWPRSHFCYEFFLNLGTVPREAPCPSLSELNRWSWAVLRTSAWCQMKITSRGDTICYSKTKISVLLFGDTVPAWNTSAVTISNVPMLFRQELWSYCGPGGDCDP